MTEEKSNPESTEPSSVGSVGLQQRPRKKFRLSRLALKELRETLRDRRTIVTLILMPLLVYPTLSLVFKTFLISNAGLFSAGEPFIFKIAYTGNGPEQQVIGTLGDLGQRMVFVEQEQKAAIEKAKQESNPGPVSSNKNEADGAAVAAPQDQLARFQEHHWNYISPDSEFSLEELVDKGAFDIAVRFDVSDQSQWEVGKAQLISRRDQISSIAADYLFQRFKEINESDLKFRLRQSKVPDGYTLKVSEKNVGEEVTQSSSQPFPLASIVPLILVLMTITGAVYPAIDLTAGERERGTLETLMAAPIPRMGILWSKFVAVLTVAVLTAMLNLVGMFATVWAFQLDKQFGAGGMFTLAVMLKVFLLLILFAAFFSALLLVVTSFAKSFKEAQVYLIPIILLSLGPGLMAMAPGMTLDGLYSVVPMVNILLLARDVIQGNVMLVPATVAIVSTLFYSYLALQLAARIFGSDSILYSGGGSFAEMFLRPIRSTYFVPIMATLFCLVMLFPINFVSIGYLGRMPSETKGDLEIRFLAMAIFTCFAFMLIPWIVAKHQRTNIQSGFGLNRPKLIFLVVAIFLGASMWPLVMSLTEGWHTLYGQIFGTESQDAWRKRLLESTSGQVEMIRRISPWVIAIAFSLVPAICEEWFFRGMLLRSLLKTNTVWKAILISAFVFGSFHMLSNSVIAIDRLIPTTLIGIMLGYLAFKSDSIIPGIVLHAVNNAFVIFLPYIQPQLSEYDWFPKEDDQLPYSWVIAGLIVAAIGTLLLVYSKRAIAELPELKHENEEEGGGSETELSSANGIA